MACLCGCFEIFFEIYLKETTQLKEAKFYFIKLNWLKKFEWEFLFLI
jgi:hypothetical protein